MPEADARVADAASETLVLVVSYDGSSFAGFQVQPDQDTVQGRLHEALATVLGRDVPLSCAGRTDAGVHALGQVVSFASDGCEPEPDALLKSLNALTGPGVVVREIKRARPGFNARHHATSRRYRYRVGTGRVPALLSSHVSWWVKDRLDTEAMESAAQALVGTHDFTSFCVAESARKHPTTRQITSISLENETVLGEPCLAIVVEGRSFLHQMVRIIVGSLVEVGRGRRAEQWIAEVLAAQDRAVAGPTAPAHGLIFEHVGYPADVWM